MKHSVVCLEWDESERGWGVRPDGASLHLTKADMQAYVREYWDTMPKEVPDEYSRPGSDKLIDVDEETYQKIKTSPTKGIRLWNTEYRQLESRQLEKEEKKEAVKEKTKEPQKTSSKIADLKKQLAELEAQELNERKTNVWDRVKGLSREDLSLLGQMIHVHFHGDGEDD